MECNSCKKDLPESCFYVLKNNDKDNLCKECRCEGCSDNKPWTFFPIMRYYNIPYIEEEGLDLMKYQIKNAIANNKPYKTIFGKYLSKMKLWSFKNYTFSDSAKLNINFQKNGYDRNLLLDRDIAHYLEILTKE